MYRTDLDPTLAFTALLEQDPSFRLLEPRDAQIRQRALLNAWYAQDKIRNLWTFTGHWLAAGRPQDPGSGHSPSGYAASH